MSIEQLDVIDTIGTDDATGQIVLTISNHLEWSDESLLLLQGKLNTYLAFVEEGEMLHSYPDAEGREILIDVVCKHNPNKNALRFLKKVGFIIEGAGMKFNFRVLAKTSNPKSE
jgi:CRP-like cAMP-binding protein